MKVLVTGATGYIGGRLIPRLLEAGHEVRTFVRHRERLAGRPWEDSVEVAVGDVLSGDSLRSALGDIDVAYYLIHSMTDNKDYWGLDRRAAENFVRAGDGLKHVIYLGGLLPAAKRVSQHLRSRAEVGEILRSGLPTTEFRAGPIIGSGSASFEMVRYVTERIPFMVAPTWIDQQVQPIAIRDMLQYLVVAAEKGPLGILEVGSDRMTYRRMLEIYAELRGLPKRRILVVPPFIAPRMATWWLGFVTPLPNSLAISLMEGIVHPIVADTSRAERVFPEVKPIAYRMAVKLALERVKWRMVETRWSGASGQSRSSEHADREGFMREVQSLWVSCPPLAVFRSFSSIGGERGWLAWEWLWEIRGLIDKILGGPGLRRGRRHPSEILVGEALDFWRVEEIDPPHMLRLRAEMRVPGQAWLQWEVKPEGSGSRLIQKALFVPFGLWGTLYWYGLYPVHHLMFRSLIRAIGRDSITFVDEEPTLKLRSDYGSLR